MQGEARKRLIQYLLGTNHINDIQYVTRRVDGFEDGAGTAYLRLATDQSANNYERVGERWQADYYLVIDVTGRDKDDVLNYYDAMLEGFTGAIIRVNSAGESNDDIYTEETYQDNTTDCEFIRIGFTLSTMRLCKAC